MTDNNCTFTYQFFNCCGTVKRMKSFQNFRSCSNRMILITNYIFDPDNNSMQPARFLSGLSFCIQSVGSL